MSVTFVETVTVFVVMVNVADVAPAGTVTETGTVAEAPPDFSATTTPPAGAGAVSVTVPVTLLPPVTLDALKVNVDRAVVAGGGVNVTVSTAVALEELATAVIVLVPVAETAPPVTVNVAELAPAGTVTETGAVATVVLEDVRVTTSPPVGATPDSVTVPVDVPFAAIDVGFRVSPVTVRSGAVTVMTAEADELLADAEIVDVLSLFTAAAETVKVAVVAPAATVTEPGTVAALTIELVSVTTKPPAGATRSRVTVPVDVLPEVILVGLNDTELTLARG